MVQKTRYIKPFHSTAQQVMIRNFPDYPAFVSPVGMCLDGTLT